jgi:hypothetical protein
MHDQRPGLLVCLNIRNRRCRSTLDLYASPRDGNPALQRAAR